jgi:sugar (pentulose or hexulose) kinase
MIRFSQLSALGLKYRGGKDAIAAIYYGTSVFNQVTNRRPYPTPPQGIIAICVFVCLVSLNSAGY